MHTFAEVPWLQPYPDSLLDEVAPSDQQPDAVVVERETIELAFLAAMQLLPPRQRAALIARDVLGWPAARDGVPAGDERGGDQQRAPAGPGHDAGSTCPPGVPIGPPGEPSDEERALLAGFIDAHERGDARAAVAIAAQDIRITMPPYPYLFEGIDVIGPLLEQAFGDERGGDWRLVPTWANRMPTAASYLRRPGDTEFRAFKFDVLRIEDGRIAEITTFGPELFPAFGLAATL